MTKIFKAYGGNHPPHFHHCPRTAAMCFFARNPAAQKCHVLEGTENRGRFAPIYRNTSKGMMRGKRYADITRRTTDQLPME
jgi:hypothetical protein